jgi:hypothetical protein
LQAAGYLRLPPDAPADPDNWFCFDEASTYFDGGEDIIAFEMSGLAKRGACPGGVPVEGSITVCLAHESCGGEWLLEASIGAETFSEQDVAYSTTDIGEVTSFAIDVGNQPAGAGGQLGFRTAAIGDGGGTLQLPVEASYFIVPLGQPDGGAIYCGGQGSSVTHDDGVTASVELVDLTRLGSCADDEANGSGAYCSNLGE